MATIKRFEEFEAWQKAKVLSKEILNISSNEPFVRDYGLKKQILDSSGSIMDNIAEGFGRGGKKELIQFLSYSKGSVAEVQSQLYRVLDRSYITKEIFDKLYFQADEISKMLNGLINYLKKSDFKGFKFHEDQETYE